MKRITFWFLSTISALVLLVGYHTSTSGPLAAGTSPALVSGTKVFSASNSSGSSGASGGGDPSKGSSSTGSASTGTTASAPKTTNVTGSVASTQWGPVQVELTVSGGTITKVTVVQYPHGDPKDAQINDYALPILTRETVDSQNANIDMVSGATVTSTGYLQSLQSALDQAGL